MFLFSFFFFSLSLIYLLTCLFVSCVSYSYSLARLYSVFSGLFWGVKLDDDVEEEPDSKDGVEGEDADEDADDDISKDALIKQPRGKGKAAVNVVAGSGSNAKGKSKAKK